jgi:serine/threonine protein kinase
MSLPPAANTVDAAALADELARFRVVDPNRLNELLGGFSGAGPLGLAEYLVARGELTAFQAERALAGEARLLALGPYRLTGRAGSGTFGPLYAARHTSKPGAFVVRVLPLRSLWKAKQAKQLARALAAGVGHPAVVPLVEVDSANGYHYLVWPQVGGEPLGARVRARGPLPAGEVAGLLGNLLSAVAACHARGAVHGALTPHAVALEPGGASFVLELGAGALLAQNVAEDESLFDSMSAAFASAEVLTYAAPELSGAEVAPGPAVDQYALGAVAYFALTGLPPYPHPTLADRIRAKRAGPPPSAAIVNPTVPADLAAVIERMMAPTPADRFAAPGEIEEQLAALALPRAGPDPEPPTDPDSLMLSKLADARRSISARNAPVPSTVSPAPRDDSDASITFDLPEPADPEAEAGARTLETEPAWAAFDTPRDVSVVPRPERTPPPTPEPDQPSAAHDPRLTAPTPVRWHTAGNPADAPDPLRPNDPPADSILWKTVKRNLLFWQATTDPVQVSVFGPGLVAPGQSFKLAVFLHPPAAATSVLTLSRAFQHDAEPLGTGFLTREVARESDLAVHLAVANAGVSKTLFRCGWRGQPQRIGFELHVPWESPEGASPGLVSVGLNNVRLGRIEFHLNVLPRKA